MKTTQLALLVTESGLPSEQQNILNTQFADFFTQLAIWQRKAEELVVTSEEQKEEMQQARQGRLLLKGLRVKVEATRKDLKEDSLKQGRAIDVIASKLKAAIEPIEAHLQTQETFAVRAIATRKENLRAERHTALLAYTSNPEFYPLGEMEAAAFDELYAGLKLGSEQRAKQARLAEQQRQAEQEAARLRQQQEAEAREAQRLENERLRAEAAERERVVAAERAETERKRVAFETAAAEARRNLEARAEREAAEAKQREAEAEARREREAAEQLRREQAEREAEAARVLAEAQAAESERLRKTAAAPDREKLLMLIDTLNAVQLPTLATSEAQQITAGVRCLLAKANAYIREKAEQL